jgi:alpha-beta hydrolase superfamily lysophospholipase
MVIVAVAGVMVMGMTGCAVERAPPGPPVAPPVLATDAFVTADGLKLPLREWLPDGAPKAVVVALHGFNDYSRAFDKVPGAPGVGPFLAARGIAVLAYDQRGFGQAPNHGIWPGRDALVGDFTAFVALVHHRFPGVPVYALGESMGGAVVMCALASPNPPVVTAAILMSPAVWARSTMPVTYRVALWISARLVPGWRPTGESLGRLASDNLAMLRENGRDPYFIKKTRIDSVYGLVNLMDEAFAAASRLRGPILYLVGRHDEIIPLNATLDATRRLAAVDGDARLAFYANGWHMIGRDKEAPVVLGDIAAFIAERAASLPSGADHDALAGLTAAVRKPPAKSTAPPGAAQVP